MFSNQMGYLPSESPRAAISSGDSACPSRALSGCERICPRSPTMYCTMGVASDLSRSAATSRSSMSMKKQNRSAALSMLTRMKQLTRLNRWLLEKNA